MQTVLTNRMEEGFPRCFQSFCIDDHSQRILNPLGSGVNLRRAAASANPYSLEARK